MVKNVGVVQSDFDWWRGLWISRFSLGFPDRIKFWLMEKNTVTPLKNDSHYIYFVVKRLA